MDKNFILAIRRNFILYGVLLVLFVLCLYLIFIGTSWVVYDVPLCQNSADAFFQSISIKESKIRRISGNSCPNYKINGDSAGRYNFDIDLPLYPKFGTQLNYVGLKSTKRSKSIGPIVLGYALNGVPIYSNLDMNGEDAILSEGATFDKCSGHISRQGWLSALLPGRYHYHGIPGDLRRDLHYKNTPIAHVSLCDEVKSWYNETKSDGHSPIFGWMLDGIPIYGPKGADGKAPRDLDECGGHGHSGNETGGSEPPFYHYHFKTVYPYSIECFRGCMDHILTSDIQALVKFFTV